MAGWITHSRVKTLESDVSSLGGTVSTLESTCDPTFYCFAVTRTVYVDCNRTDEYTPDGSFPKPYKTILAARDKAGTMSPTEANPVVIKVAPGSYAEDISEGKSPDTGMGIPDDVHVIGIGDSPRAVRVTGIKGVHGAHNMFKFSGVNGRASVRNLTIHDMPGNPSCGIYMYRGTKNYCENLYFERVFSCIHVGYAGVEGKFRNIEILDSQYAIKAYGWTEGKGSKLAGHGLHVWLTYPYGHTKYTVGMTAIYSGWQKGNCHVEIHNFKIEGMKYAATSYEDSPIELFDGVISNVYRAFRIPAAADETSTIRAFGVRVENSGDADLSVTNNGLIEVTGCELDCSKFSLANATFYGSYFCSNCNAFHTGEVKIKVYSQAAEPTLGADQNMAMWIDTDAANKVYLVYRRSVGDQVKVQLT